MTFLKALAVSATLVFAALVGLLLWGLMGDGSIGIPLLLDVSHTRSTGGEPQSSLQFSPLGAVLAALVLALPLWGAARLVADRHGTPDRLPR